MSDNNIMGNWSINLCAGSKAHFETGMRLAFEANCPGNKTAYFAISDDSRHLVFMWGLDPSQKIGPISLEMLDEPIPAKLDKLPYEMDVNAAIDFAWHWLQNASNQGKEIWSDEVWRETGFRLHTDYWGHALGHPYGVIAVTGEHKLIGK